MSQPQHPSGQEEPNRWTSLLWTVLTIVLVFFILAVAISAGGVR